MQGAATEADAISLNQGAGAEADVIGSSYMLGDGLLIYIGELGSS